MFAMRNHRLDFADTRATNAGGGATDSAWSLSAFSRLEGSDAADSSAHADAADRQLMHLVVCAAAATLLLALAASLAG